MTDAPEISPEIDALLDKIEAGGMNLYCMAGVAVGGSFADLPPFLSFEFVSDTPTPEALAAASEMSAIFKRDRDVREAIIELCMQLGSAYRNHHQEPMWRPGETRQ